MGVARRIVFPALRIIIWGVIAVALCVIAFGKDETAPPGFTAHEPYPGSEFTDPTITAATQTLENTVSLSGTITPEAPVEVKAAADGTAVYFALPSGDWVDVGAPLMTIRHSEEREPLERVDEWGNVTLIPQPPHITETTVIATAAGRITFAAALNDQLTGGDVVARISPEKYYFQATVPPADLYRLVDLPESAQLTIAQGPPPFDCTEMRFTSAEPESGEEGSSGTSLRCEIPADVKVFPGLTASVSITTQRAENALVLPVTAVRGSFESGSVWLINDAGEPVETGVQLGLTDGHVIQIVEGITAGDEVLEFVPADRPQYPVGHGDDSDDGSGWYGVPSIPEDPDDWEGDDVIVEDSGAGLEDSE